MKVFIITFKSVDFQDLTCVERAETSGDALRSIMSVWGPPAEITDVKITPVELFQINLDDPDSQLEVI